MSEDTTLRAALERIASCDRVVAGDVVDIARQALAAASQEREPEWEVDRLKAREAHFAKVLGVADGGQYRNDWDSTLSALLAEVEQLRAIVGKIPQEQLGRIMQRVDDEQPDPPSADSLAKPLDQGDNL